MKTVGELKEFIKDLPDDMLLVKYKSNMETNGYRNELSCNVVNMKEKVKSTHDAFDGTYYTYKVFLPSEDGKACLEFL